MLILVFCVSDSFKYICGVLKCSVLSSHLQDKMKKTKTCSVLDGLLRGVYFAVTCSLGIKVYAASIGRFKMF